MRVLLEIALGCVLAGSGMAQHGGAGGHGGGIGGFGHGGGIGIGHSGSIGGFGHGYVGSGGFRGIGIGPGFGYHGGGTFYRPYAFPGHGIGFSYWPGYYGPYSYWGYPYASYGYSYQPSPNITVVYPAQTQATPTTVYVDRAHPATREYDEYGQEVMPATGDSGASSSPIYLIAFKDHVIRAASAYWVDGETLHYITLRREKRQAPLATVDRDFSSQLNRERRVPFQLPAQ